MSAADLIAGFATTQTVKRRAAGSYVNGNWVPGLESTLSIQISIQPLTDKERLNLPEAQRTRRILKGYTATLLKTVDEAAKTPSDKIVFDGTEFEVVRVETWPGNLNHWKVQLAEVNR